MTDNGLIPLSWDNRLHHAFQLGLFILILGFSFHSNQLSFIQVFKQSSSNQVEKLFKNMFVVITLSYVLPNMIQPWILWRDRKIFIEPKDLGILRLFPIPFKGQPLKRMKTKLKSLKSQTSDFSDCAFSVLQSAFWYWIWKQQSWEKDWLASKNY